MQLRKIFILSFLVALCVLGMIGSAILPEDGTQALGSILPMPQALPTAAPAVVAGCFYRVQRGDNLFRIGLRYGVTYPYLAALNGIPNPNLIYAGSVLEVPCGGAPVVYRPANCAPSQSYTVVAGDNLFRIAYNYKTDLNLLRSTNNMYGRVLRPGMVLTIPCPGSVQYREIPPPGQVATAVPTAPAEATPVPATPPPGPEVQISGGQFNPANFDLQVGTTVTWINDSNTAYTLVCPACAQNGLSFGSTPIEPNGGTYSFRFDAIGRYDYQTQEDPNIKGTITVR